MVLAGHTLPASQLDRAVVVGTSPLRLAVPSVAALGPPFLDALDDWTTVDRLLECDDIGGAASPTQTCASPAVRWSGRWRSAGPCFRSAPGQIGPRPKADGPAPRGREPWDPYPARNP